MSIFGLNERKMQEYNLLVTEMFPIAEKKQILLPASSCPAVRQEETEWETSCIRLCSIFVMASLSLLTYGT